MDFRNNNLTKKIKSERLERAFRAKSLDSNRKCMGIHSTVFSTLLKIYMIQYKNLDLKETLHSFSKMSHQEIVYLIYGLGLCR